MSLDSNSSHERLSFTIFLAAAIVIIIILGLSFTKLAPPKPSPTLNVTIATHNSNKRNDDAKWLAEFDQEASGTADKAEELTTRQQADVVAPNINEVNPIIEQRSVLANEQETHYITTKTSDFKLSRREALDDPDNPENIDAGEQDRLELTRDQASLLAKLDQLNRAEAERPRIRYMTSLSTKSAVEARYLNEWTQRIESVGNKNFPQYALDNKIFGSLRLAVRINSDGSIDSIDLLQSSGHKILDQAALQTVRRSSPFSAFPIAIRENFDQLDIIRTWRFEITGLSTDD